MSILSEKVNSIYDYATKLHGDLSGRADAEGIAEASGFKRDIIDRIEQGMKLFNEVIESKDEKKLSDVIDSLEDAEAKGFLLSWYSAMGGEADLTELAQQDKETLTELALAQNEISQREALQEICNELANIFEETGKAGDRIPELTIATAIYAQNEEFNDYPEIIGMSVAAQAYISGCDVNEEEFENLLLKVLYIILMAVALLAVAVPAAVVTYAVCMAIGTGIIMKILSAIFALTVAVIAAKLVINVIVSLYASNETQEVEETEELFEDEEEYQRTGILV